MHISYFTALCLGTLIIVAISEGWAKRRWGADSFVFIVLDKLDEILSILFVTALTVCILNLGLWLWFGEKTPIETLLFLEDLKLDIAAGLEVISPSPWIIIAAAGILYAVLIFLEKVSKSAERISKVFLFANRWIGRAAPVTALLASVTFLSGDEGPTGRVSIALAEARQAVAAVERQIDAVAARAVSAAFANEVSDALVAAGGANWRSTAASLNAMKAKAGQVGVRAETEIKSRQLLGSTGRRTTPKPAATPVSRSDLARFSPTSAPDLKLLERQLSRLSPSNRAASSVPIELMSTLRNETAKLVLQKGTLRSLRASLSGSPLASLVVDMIAETAIERLGQNFASSKERIRSALTNALTSGQNTSDAVRQAMFQDRTTIDLKSRIPESEIQRRVAALGRAADTTAQVASRERAAYLTERVALAVDQAKLQKVIPRNTGSFDAMVREIAGARLSASEKATLTKQLRSAGCRTCHM